MKEWVVKVISCQRLSETVSKLLLHAPNFKYQAGQYIQVVHDDKTVSPLSIACKPNEEHVLELHLSHAPQNTAALDILKIIAEKNQLLLQGPLGTCTADKIQLDKPTIFLAGGTGFAPIKAVLEELFSKPNCPLLHLYWGAAKESELYLSSLPKLWSEEFKNFHFNFVLSRPGNEWEGIVGQLPAIVLQDFPDMSDVQVYASGPEALVFAALELFRKNGLEREFFYSDLI